MKRQRKHIKFIAAVISLFAMVTMTTVQAGDMSYTIPGGGDFHPPRSAAEMVLETIFKYDADDEGIVDYLLGVPHRDVKKDKNFAGLFTPDLRDAVSGEEIKEISDCGGVYDEGGRCGLEFSPVICAQDIPDEGVLYRLEYEDNNKSIITMRWPWIEEPTGTYTLIRDGTSWTLDGILCRETYGNFNFTDMDKIKGLTSKPREP